MAVAVMFLALIVSGAVVSAPRVLMTAPQIRCFARARSSNNSARSATTYDAWNYARSAWLSACRRNRSMLFSAGCADRALRRRRDVGAAHGKNLIVIQVESLQISPSISRSATRR